VRQASRKTIRWNVRAVGLVAAAVCLCCAGCRKGLESAYGHRSGFGVEKSVNGTRVLGELFEQAGHRVLSWNRLSPRLWQRADCIVWFPNDFDAPSEPARDWLESWLEEKPGRRLIYVGRDFDAASWYWKKLEPSAPAARREAWKEYRRKAEERFARRRGGTLTRDESPWFKIDRKPSKRTVRTLSGDDEWLDGIHSKKLEIELRGRLVPAEGATVLLASEGDSLVSRQAIGQGELILVANGSFLLNLPLVNHEHRKLAGKLVDRLGTERRTVVFLESGERGPRIVEKEPVSGTPTGVEIFNLWPTNWILLHLAAVGILFCFWRFPIFGPASPGEPERLSDFGKHLDAVAELLRQSGNEQYARDRIQQYVQRVKPTDGK